jgi:hypothetical protein
MTVFLFAVFTIIGIGSAKEATYCIGIVDWNPLPEPLAVVTCPLIPFLHRRQYPVGLKKKFSEPAIERIASLKASFRSDFDQ